MIFRQSFIIGIGVLGAAFLTFGAAELKAQNANPETFDLNIPKPASDMPDLESLNDLSTIAPTPQVRDPLGNETEKLQLPDAAPRPSAAPSEPVSLPMPSLDAPDDGLVLLPETDIKEAAAKASKDAPFQVSDPEEFGSTPLVPTSLSAPEEAKSDSDIDLTDLEVEPTENIPITAGLDHATNVLKKVAKKAEDLTKTSAEIYAENEKIKVKKEEEEAELIEKRWNIDYHVQQAPKGFFKADHEGDNRHLSPMTDQSEFKNYALEASLKGDLNTLRLMVDEIGGDVNITDKEQNSLLILATYGGHVNAVRWLLVRGANVDAANQYGTTALHLAARANRVDLARALISMGANMYFRDSADKTPIDYALEHHYQEMVELLMPSDLDDTSKKDSE